ncbi:LptF/LptG family permease [Roseomonas sp. BN140053]|uniref:LptF/LptG family permease n=1 Tax=Roseomonas sp. BN140053 TaxID=3391898 RepID=UPI0039E88DE2
MSVLSRHLSRLFLGRWLAALLALSVLLQMLDLLDNATAVLTRGGGALGVLHYAALRLPSAAERLVPLAALLAALLTFARLAAGSEAATLRALGVGGPGMVRALLPACVLVAGLQFVLTDQVVPRTQRAFADWWAALPKADPPSDNDRLWLRLGDDILAVRRVEERGTRLSGVLLVRRDAEGEAVARLDAAGAAFRPQGWELRDVRVASLDGSLPRQVAAMPWPEGPRPRNLAELALPIESVPLEQILRVLDGRWVGNRGEGFYRTRLQERLAALPSAAIMLLLAFPATLALPRRGGAGRWAALSLLLGLGYVALGGGLAALGEAGVLMPALAAWTAPVAFGCAGLVLLLHLEG